MAKSPKRSNREVRKPKAIRTSSEPAAVSSVAVANGGPPRKPKGTA